MQTLEKIKLLKAHSVKYWETNNKLYCVEYGTCQPAGIPYSETLDITDWSRGKLLAWLGY